MLARAGVHRVALNSTVHVDRASGRGGLRLRVTGAVEALGNSTLSLHSTAEGLLEQQAHENEQRCAPHPC